MKRRELLRLLGGAFAALTGTTHAAPTSVERWPELPAAPSPGAGLATGSPTLLIQESPVAGFQYHEGERLWPRLQEGQGVELVREPGNRYDRRAVRVDWRGRKLGYLPRVENAAVSQMLDRGERLSARIVGLEEGADPWRRVRVAVWWNREAVG